MSVTRIATRRVKVIEQDELGCALPVIRRHTLPEHHQRRLAIALRQIAEELIVGAVLLDDVDPVLDERRIAGTLRHGQRCAGGLSACEALPGCRDVIVFRDGCGEAGELRRIWYG